MTTVTLPPLPTRASATSPFTARATVYVFGTELRRVAMKQSTSFSPGSSVVESSTAQTIWEPLTANPSFSRSVTVLPAPVAAGSANASSIETKRALRITPPLV